MCAYTRTGELTNSIVGAGGKFKRAIGTPSFAFSCARPGRTGHAFFYVSLARPSQTAGPAAAPPSPLTNISFTLNLKSCTHDHNHVTSSSLSFSSSCFLALLHSLATMQRLDRTRDGWISLVTIAWSNSQFPLSEIGKYVGRNNARCVIVRCRALQRVVTCCRVAACGNVLQCVAACCHVVQRVCAINHIFDVGSWTAS